MIHGWLNVPHCLSTHFAAMLQDRLHLFVAFCTLAYCAFQKHANSKVQKPTDVFCYSQTSLIRTPKRQDQVSALQRCPYYRGREFMIFGISGTKRTVRNREVSVL